MSETPTRQEPGWFWRLFGGTLLSLLGLLGVTLVSICLNNISETRIEVGKLSREQGETMKLADWTSRMKGVWSQLREIPVVKERTTSLELQLKSEREETKALMKEIQLLRERIAVIEGKLASPTKAD